MEKIECGMYVRTKDGDMFILDKIEDNHLIPRYVHIPYVIIEEDVIKASYNIIDLIEVGDYVNGELVLKKVLYGNNAGVKVFGNIYYSEEIKSIVTKEQFSQIEYRLGE